MKIENLNKTYDRRSANANHVLRDVSFTLPDTGFVCILGPSGCGKTSLLNAVGGLDRFDSGCITIGDVTVNSYGTAAYEAERNAKFGYIFQNYYLLQNHSVAYNVYLGLHSLNLSHREKLRRVREALEAVDMERFLRRRVDALSGGQQQRVAIARALARRPRVIFADEPTGNLDEANTVNICTLLRKISKTSLVVMVTHEERIANFFADRIIRLENGAIAANTGDWDRDGLSLEGGNSLYAGDYREANLRENGVSLRILREEGAEPVDLTVVALKDRIVIKLEDFRTVTCGTGSDSPVLKEGCRPVMTLENLDQTESIREFTHSGSEQGKAGQGLGVPMLFAEARELVRGRDKKWLAAWFFMVLLTVLSLWMVGDYLTLKTVDPRDFVLTHSHVLEMSLERGENHQVDPANYMQATQLRGTIGSCLEDMKDYDVDFEILPYISAQPELAAEGYFPQLDNISVKLSRFSYIPLDYLNPESLILGRMPENVNEIVVDRWVLDSVLAEDGILQNSISDISFFLGRTLNFPKVGYEATIVGISDDGEAALYASRSVLATVAVGGKSFITLSELKSLFPGQFDHLTLEDGQCITIRKQGVAQNKPGQPLTFNVELKYIIAQEIEADCYASVVVADSQVDTIVKSLAVIDKRCILYCPDKEAVKAALTEDPLPLVADQQLQIELDDRYSDSWSAYTQASRMKADARTVVTVTVMLLVAVMLYLLRRSQVQSRLELLAVYRLLGIPGSKLSLIFLMESVLNWLAGSLPAALVVYGGVTVLTNLENVAFSMVLPLGAAVATAVAILAYHITVSLLPLLRLLRLPPAQLAAKHDF